MRIGQLATLANLRLAWRRITTGGNHNYKQLFRELYVAYEVALEDNLLDLRTRLIGGTFTAKQPERVYLPKSSGLHRPLSLLHIEDQIVLQAFANLAAKRLHKKRAPLQFKFVFSNILEKDTSIFFFRRWQQTFAAFQKRIVRHYAEGLRWVADFDLAAFYDTVSHELLLKTIYPKGPPNGDLEWLRSCLGVWSSEKAASRHGHGIPQGPIASDFLAECFLLPIDLALQSPGYTRYVDDVRIFGRTEDDVRAAVVQLERRCREHGLIPQTGKFAIRHASGLTEALGMLPSIADPHHRSGTGDEPLLSRDEARSLFTSSLEGKPLRVRDKTRLRYVLYRAEPDSDLLRRVLRLIPLHPEHADVLFRYVNLFAPRAPVRRLCLSLIEGSPYPYVRGEAWLLLARYLTAPKGLDVAVRKNLIERAIALAKKRRAENFTETLGACHFLAASQSAGRARHSRFLRFQPPLLQAFAAPVLPEGAITAGEVAEDYLRSPAFEPGLAICGRLVALGRGLDAFGLTPADVHSQVNNTLRALGATPSPGKAVVDPIAETLKARYGVPPSKSWHALLGAEYGHALGMLKLAEAAFNTSTSFWLSNQNSFQHAVFMALQRHLASTGHAAACSFRGRDGKLIDFGVMLDAGGPFSRGCAPVGDAFRAMNTRRNSLPVSHPYEKKTERRTRHLAVRERDRFVQALRAAYPAFVALMP